jgi:hypothetical protein
MIDRKHNLPISKQAEALNISRGSIYYLPRPVPKTELAIMHRLDRLHLEYPFAGSRMLWATGAADADLSANMAEEAPHSQQKRARHRKWQPTDP